jgi:hypothetical protein
MFYLLKHLRLLLLVNLKQKCNNLIVNEILILYASYVCLLHSRFIENHLIWILDDGPLLALTKRRFHAPTYRVNVCNDHVFALSTKCF